MTSHSSEMDFVGCSCLRCENGAEIVPCVGPPPGWTYEESSGWLCPVCTLEEVEALRQEVRDLEQALAAERRLRPASSGNARRAEENVIIYWLDRRDATPVADRLTLRMAAHDIISTLDEHRQIRAEA